MVDPTALACGCPWAWRGHTLHTTCYGCNNTTCATHMCTAAPKAVGTWVGLPRQCCAVQVLIMLLLHCLCCCCRGHCCLLVLWPASDAVAAVGNLRSSLSCIVAGAPNPCAHSLGGGCACVQCRPNPQMWGCSQGCEPMGWGYTPGTPPLLVLLLLPLLVLFVA